MVCSEDVANTLGADDYKEPQMVISFQERSGKPGGARESSSRKKGPEH